MDNSIQTECDKFLSLAEHYLDNGMTPEEEQEFLTLLESNSNCLHMFRLEKHFRDLLLARVERKTIDRALVEGIRSRIREEIVATA